MKQRYTHIKYQLSRDTRILFIGTNPSPGTYRRQIPFSNNKSFWYLLSDAGLIDETREELKNDALLKKLYLEKFNPVYKLGLLNLVHRPSKTISEVTQEEAVPGGVKIMAAIRRYDPFVVCFVGKGTYQLFTQRSRCDYGWQNSLYQSLVFVMHSPLHGPAHIRIKELQEVGRAVRLLR
jgi:TDG/mug DNA glycosylase family protein